MKIAFSLPLIVLLLYSYPARSQETVPSMSLEEAVRYAWSNNTTIRQKQIDVADAQQQILENQAYGIPQLNAGADFTRYVVVPKAPIPEAFRTNPDGTINPDIPTNAAFQLANNFSAYINLDAMIFDPKFFVGLKAAKQFKVVVAQELESEKRNVRSTVVNSYLPVLLVNQNIELLDSNIAIVERLLFETEKLYESGFAEQLDVDRQQLALANLSTQRQSLEGQKVTALKRLKYNIGYPVDDPLVVESTLEELLALADEESLTAPVDLQRRPDYLLTQEALKINEMRVDLEQASYYPSMRAFGSAQQTYQGNTSADDFWAPAVFVGATLSVPIFSGLERRSKVERAQLALAEVEVQQQDLVRAIRLQVGAARNDYNTAFQVYENQQNNLSLAERIFETTQIKYREGVGNSVELVQAEQSLYDAQRNYLQALYDLVLAKQNLDIALGN